MIDIGENFITLLKDDSDLGDPESLSSLVGSRISQDDFIVLDAMDNYESLSRFPTITYIYTFGGVFQDKSNIPLVVNTVTKRYNDCVAVANRITYILLNPKKRIGTAKPSLESDSFRIGYITKPGNDLHFKHVELGLHIIQAQYQLNLTYKGV